MNIKVGDRVRIKSIESSHLSMNTVNIGDVGTVAVIYDQEVAGVIFDNVTDGNNLSGAIRGQNGLWLYKVDLEIIYKGKEIKVDTTIKFKNSNQ
ncbi:MAG: hypothetical protein IH948_00085 [Bacteroidetes bacterium]|nr:hypothetical protein [Bacteroidota bacterium]